MTRNSATSWSGAVAALADALALAICDGDGRVVDATDAFLDLVGRTRADVGGVVLPRAEPGPVECRVASSDGTVRTVVARSAPHESGFVLYATARPEVRAEAEFKSFANAIPELAWIADEDGSISWYNDRWYEYTGTTPEEMRGWGWQKVLHPEHVDRVLAEVRELFRSGDAWEDTFPLRGKNGEWRWFLTRATPIRDAAGKTVRFFGTNTDVTEHRAALEERERLLHDAEYEKSRFETIMKQLPAAVVIGEAPTGKLVFANEKINDVWGHAMIEADEVTGYRNYVGFHPDGRRYEGRDWPLARAIEKGEVVTDEDVEILRGDGRRAVVRINAAPLRDRSGAIVAAVVISQDVTSLMEAIRLREEFISIASHELKTPLTGLKLQLEVLRRVIEKEPTGVTARVAAAVEKVRAHSNRLAVLVDDLLDVTRVQAGKVSYAMAEADVNAVVLAAVDRLGETLRNAGCAVDVDVPATPSLAWVDAGRIEQVMVNLLANAAKYASGAPVTVTVRSDTRDVYVSVADLGHGVAEEMRERIFERFTRATSYRNVSGLGLGLHIAREIVRTHTGEIWVDPHPEGGATFTFRVPRRPIASPPLSAPPTSR